MSNKQDEASVELATQIPEQAPAKGKTKPETRTKPKLLPPYAVILLNDHEHSFQFVIESLRKTFGYSTFKAMRLTLRAHVAGRALVWTGSKEVAEFKRERLRSCGPDIYAMRPVGYPLRCEIEPMA